MCESCGFAHDAGLDGGEVGATVTPSRHALIDAAIEKTRWVKPNSFVTKDSGDREEFDSGMVRDTNGGKPRFDLLIPKGIPYEDLYLTRIARLYERGAVKYAPRNWEKADSQEELDRAKESAFRHFMQWYAGEADEDHAAAVFFNVNEVETILAKGLQ